MNDKTPQEIEKELAQHYGSETIYRHPLISSFLYTEGIRAMAKLCQAKWLIDLIVSYQPICCKIRSLSEFQLWTPEKTGKRWTVSVKEDSDKKPFKKQKILFSDFPLESIKFYVCKSQDENGKPFWILMLPSEY